ncbi:hypothetical protein S1OALGB6SA_2024 [Olavius algarvensis spirochete endosymbiont]|nr:MAG: hypothetical protein [Olavius algarvensis spirochete endosymbiont]VDB00932.1 hypothetical protein S1OALGB6SA_2024 [Olavius algarvensis spirochete endosymbiont]
MYIHDVAPTTKFIIQIPRLCKKAFDEVVAELISPCSTKGILSHNKQYHRSDSIVRKGRLMDSPSV